MPDVRVFEAQLLAHPEVVATVALRSDRTLDDLHHLLRKAFRWTDDHLYSFWLDGQFWGSEEYTSPVEIEPGQRGADVPLADLRIKDGQRIAYLFDFGDSWEVEITVRPSLADDGSSGARVIEVTGEPPQQYSKLDDDDLLDDDELYEDDEP